MSHAGACDDPRVPSPLRAAAFAATALVLLCASASPASAKSTYCSPTGDYCHGAVRQDGAMRLTFETFSFSGRVQVCVTGPKDRTTCHRFRLQKRKAGTYGFRVRWSAHFPDQGRGTYRVRFRYMGSNLGPRDTFRR